MLGRTRMRRNGSRADRDKKPIWALIVFFLCAMMASAGIVVLLRERSHSARAPSGLPQGGRPAASQPEVTEASKGTNQIPEMPPLPEDAAALVNIGNELLKKGQLTQAIEVYLKALAKNPDDEEVHFNLGFAYSRQGKTAEAIKEYEEALKIFPDYTEAHNNLGNILVAQRQYEEGIKHFEAALRNSPEDSS